MGRRVKATKERCLKCQYVMNLTGTSMVKKGENSGALVACGYCLKERDGGCRIAKDGKKRKDFQFGYCNFYKEGPRKRSFDNLASNNTLKKGKKDA